MNRTCALLLLLLLSSFASAATLGVWSGAGSSEPYTADATHIELQIGNDCIFNPSGPECVVYFGQSVGAANVGTTYTINQANFALFWKVAQLLADNQPTMLWQLYSAPPGGGGGGNGW